jgi:hypothetical protein
MVVKHKKTMHRHPAIQRMRRELDKIENEIAEKTADKVVHELRESRKTERMEHKRRPHPKGCKCAIHRRKR